MKELLTKKQRKLLTLLEILIEHDEWATEESLCASLHCTNRMLKNYLNEISLLFNQYAIVTSQKGIKIEYADSISSEMIYHHFYNQSVKFQILEYLFFHECISIEQLAEKFYLSIPSLYRIIREINSCIRKYYKFWIGKSPLQFQGNEAEIRYFFAQYFTEKYYRFDWPFENINEKILEEFILYFYKPSHFPINFSVFHSVKTLTAVTMHRIKLKKVVKLENRFDEIIELYTQLPDFSTQIMYYQNRLNVELSKDNIAQLFIFYTQKNFFFNFEELKKHAQTDDYTQRSLTALNQLFDYFSQKYQLSLPNRELLTLHIHNTAQLENKEIFYHYVLFDKKRAFHHNIQKISPPFYKELTTWITNYLEVLQKKDERLTQHLIYTLVVHWENLFIELTRQQKVFKVYIISDFDFEHARIIKDALEYHLSKRFEFTILDDLYLDAQKLNQLNCDIILANFMVPEVTTKKYICTNGVSILKVVAQLNEYLLFNE